MAAAMECWSRKSTNDDDLVEQVLMVGNDRSEDMTTLHSSNSSLMHKKLHRLGRNVSEAIASFKNSLNLDSPREIHSCRNKPLWDNVVRNLSHPFPGNRQQLIRKHQNSFPNSYSQAGFEIKEVLLHMQLIEQAVDSCHPCVDLQHLHSDEVDALGFKLTFACNSSISCSAISSCLEASFISCKNVQIYEKKGCSLGVVQFIVQQGHDKMLKARVESALKNALKKPRPSTVKLPFGLCGCQLEGTTGREHSEFEEDPSEQMNRIGSENAPLPLQIPLPGTYYRVLVDEWQTVCFGRAEIDKWLLTPDGLEFGDQISPNYFKGVFKGKRVAIEKLRGCDKGNSFEFELRQDLLELMTCGHKNIVQFYGVCIDEYHGLCILTQLMESGSLMDHMSKKKRFLPKEVLKIMADVAEGLRFMNDHGVAYKDLNTQRIMLDRHGNARLGDMGIVSACKGVETLEYETDGFRWLAPEIIAADPETVTETWMSNVYSFGMVLWEMVTGEAAYDAYSPVQAAVGIAACGLRPEIPKDCPPALESLMTKCWNSSPNKRPEFTEIISVLLQPTSNTR